MKYVLFKISERYFGISIANIREILKTPEITPVPNSPEFIEGVLCLRHHNIVVMDLRKRLGYAEGEIKKAEHVLMSKVGKAVVGLLVDQALDIFEASQEEVRTISGEENPFVNANVIVGATQVGEHTALLLNAENFLNSSENLELMETES